MIVRVAAAALAVCAALEVLVEVAEVELELRLVAVLAPGATVVIGVPVSKRNLPTPVSQQSVVWSQHQSRLEWVAFAQVIKSVPPVLAPSNHQNLVEVDGGYRSEVDH